VLLPGAVGALATVLVVNGLPRRRKQVLLAGGLLVLLAAGFWAYRTFRQAVRPEMTNRDALHQLMSWFTFAQGSLVPSHWMTLGLQAAARGQWLHPRGGTVYYLALGWSTGLAVYLLAAWTARHLYRRGYNRVATGGALRKRYGGHQLDDLLTSAL